MNKTGSWSISMQQIARKLRRHARTATATSDLQIFTKTGTKMTTLQNSQTNSQGLTLPPAHPFFQTIHPSRSQYSPSRFTRTCCDFDKQQITRSKMFGLSRPNETIAKRRMRRCVEQAKGLLLLSVEGKGEKGVFLRQVELVLERCGRVVEEKVGEVLREGLTVLVNYAIDLGLLREFELSMYFLAEIYRTMGVYNRAVYLLDQVRLSCYLTSNNLLMINVLISLGKCCSSNCQYPQSLSFYKKSLQFAWLQSHRQKQLQLYDQIGKMYFRLHRLQRATYYHSRFSNGSLQSPESGLRQMIQLQRFHKRNPQPVSEMTILYLTKLFVPVRSAKELKCLGGNKWREQMRAVDEALFYEVPSQTELVRGMLSEEEFRQDMPDPMEQREKVVVRQSRRLGNQDRQLDCFLRRYMKSREKGVDKQRKSLGFDRRKLSLSIEVTPQHRRNLLRGTSTTNQQSNLQGIFFMRDKQKSHKNSTLILVKVYCQYIKELIK